MTVYSTIIKGGVLIDTRRCRYDTRLPEDSGEWRRVTPCGTRAPSRARGNSEKTRVPYASPIGGCPGQTPPGTLRSCIATVLGAVITVYLEWLLFVTVPSLAQWVVPVFIPPFLGVLVCAALLGPAASPQRLAFAALLGQMLIFAALGGMALWNSPSGCMLLALLAVGALCSFFSALFGGMGSELATLLLGPLWRVQQRRARARRWQRTTTPRYRALTSGEVGSCILFIPLAQAIAFGLVLLITEVLGVRFEEGVPWMPLVTGFLAGLVCSLGLGAERRFEPRELVKAALIGQLYWGPVILVVLMFSPGLALLWPMESLCGTAIGAYTAERLILRHRTGAAQP